MSLRIALVSLVLTLFTSCHHTVTSKSICEGHETHIPELEGSYEYESSQIKFKKTNLPGRYELKMGRNSTEISTCVADDKVFFSKILEPGDTNDEIQVFKLDFVSSNELRVSSVALDENILKANNVPYKRHKFNRDGVESFITEIDNTNHNATDILSAEMPTAKTFGDVLIRL